MLNWFRSRRPASPAPSARLGTELWLDDRITPCAGHDMMAAVVAAPVAADAAQPPVVAPDAQSEPSEGQVTPAFVAPPVAAPPDVQQAIPDAPLALPPETGRTSTTGAEPPVSAALQPSADEMPVREAEFSSN